MSADERLVLGSQEGAGALMASLTDREKEILKAIAVGMPNKVIGARLYHLRKDGKDARQPHLPQAWGGQQATGHAGVSESPAGRRRGVRGDAPA